MHPRKSKFIKLFEGSGLSQASVARLLGVSRACVHDVIKDTGVPSETLVRLFELSIGHNSIPRANSDLSDLAALRSDLAKFPPAQRRELIKALRQLLACVVTTST
jgi:predicted DNA-binding protein YlxM (UPF0122 family)